MEMIASNVAAFATGTPLKRMSGCLGVRGRSVSLRMSPPAGSLIVKNGVGPRISESTDTVTDARPTFSTEKLEWTASRESSAPTRTACGCALNTTTAAPLTTVTTAEGEFALSFVASHAGTARTRWKYNPSADDVKEAPLTPIRCCSTDVKSDVIDRSMTYEPVPPVTSDHPIA